MNKKTLPKHTATTTTTATLPARRRQVSISTPRIPVTIATPKARLSLTGIKSQPLLVPILVFILTVLVPWLVLPDFTIKLANFLNIFLGLTIEVLPFLLLGAIFGAGLAVWQRGSSRIWKLASKNRFTAVLGGLGLGFALPVCECGTATVARQATRSGAPTALTMVFLLAAPIINPITILVTWLAFGNDWLMVLGRVALGLIVAVAVGLLFSLHPNSSGLFTPFEKNVDSHHQGHSHKEGEACHETSTRATSISNYLDRVVAEFLEAVRIVLPGVALASAFQAYLSQKFFLEIGQGPLLSALALMLLAFLLSACSSVDAFIVLGFAGLFPVGSVLAFVVFGPLVNLKSLFLMRMVLTWRTIGLMVLLIAQFVMLAAVLINLHT